MSMTLAHPLSSARWEDPVPAEATEPREVAANSITRLLCARTYLLGIVGSAASVHALLGAPFRASDPGVGYDRRTLAYHALQSGLFSLAVLALCVVLFYASYEELWRLGTFGPWSWLLVALVTVKVAVVNPWIARVFFRHEGQIPEFSLPLIGALARGLRDRFFPESDERSSNTYYFKGARPFVGSGTEINAWTVVVDTSESGSGIENVLGAQRKIRDVDESDLYGAVLRGIDRLGAKELRPSWRVFVDGLFADEEKQRGGGVFRRPPQALASKRIEELDQQGTRGRKYLVLEARNDGQDLVATQFIRFHKDGKLMFCEFASYLLAPGLRALYVMDRMINVSGFAYLITGLLWFLITAFSATLFFPITESIMFMEVPGFLIYGPENIGSNYVSIINSAIEFGLLAHAIVAFSALYLLALMLLRIVRFLLTSLGILLGISRQFGIAFSYRERFASRGQLDYYALQEAIRFLKIQEKLLVHSICDELKERGIDVSDFKETISAYVNQGVINSGNIRGDVFTSVKSFVFRRPARSAISRAQRRAARA